MIKSTYAALRLCGYITADALNSFKDFPTLGLSSKTVQVYLDPVLKMWIVQDYILPERLAFKTKAAALRTFLARNILHDNLNIGLRDGLR